jgi:hypothetical protein
MESRVDVVIAGLGGMGSAAAFWAASMGASVQGRPAEPRRDVWRITAAGIDRRMIWLLLLLLLILVVGVIGAIKIALWVILIALLVALVAGFLGRGLFSR